MDVNGVFGMGVCPAAALAVGFSLFVSRLRYAWALLKTSPRRVVKKGVPLLMFTVQTLRTAVEDIAMKHAWSFGPVPAKV
jgi:hypothetical protein